jgi:hypothetical protein
LIEDVADLLDSNGDNFLTIGTLFDYLRAIEVQGEVRRAQATRLQLFTALEDTLAETLL